MQMFHFDKENILFKDNKLLKPLNKILLITISY